MVLPQFKWLFLVLSTFESPPEKIGSFTIKAMSSESLESLEMGWSSQILQREAITSYAAMYDDFLLGTGVIWTNLGMGVLATLKL